MLLGILWLSIKPRAVKADYEVFYKENSLRLFNEV